MVPGTATRATSGPRLSRSSQITPSCLCACAASHTVKSSPCVGRAPGGLTAHTARPPGWTTGGKRRRETIVTKSPPPCVSDHLPGVPGWALVLDSGPQQDQLQHLRGPCSESRRISSRREQSVQACGTLPGAPLSLRGFRAASSALSRSLAPSPPHRPWCRGDLSRAQVSDPGPPAPG